MPVEFYFDSLSALWTMDGHGPYVWSVYLIVVAVLAALAIQPIVRRRQLLQKFREQLQRQTVAAVSRTSSSVMENS